MNDFASYIGGLTGAVISLLLEWFPPLKKRFSKLNSYQKSGCVALVTLVVAIVIATGQCYGWLRVGAPAVACGDGAWAEEVIRVAVIALGMGQLTHYMAKKRAV
jgi:hypothetical protein